MVLSHKSRKVISLLVPLLLLILLVNDFYGYGISSVRLWIDSTVIVLGFVYLGFRAKQGGKIPKPRNWPIVLFVFFYIVVRAFLSGNIYVSLPRLVIYLTLGVVFFLLWDGFDDFLDRSKILDGFLILTSIFMLLALFEVWLAYQGWWDLFGIFGEKPPINYRITKPIGPNQLIAILNLFLPYVVVSLFGNIGFKNRVGLIFWIIMYSGVFIFVSSRGGFVGLVAGVGSLVLFNINYGKIKDKYFSFSKKTRLLIYLAVFLIFTVVVVSGYFVLAEMSAHPTHGDSGGGINLNRSNIWGGYYNLFKSNPLFGTGVGSYILNYFEENTNIPPDWFPIHAHSLPLMLLSELGILGGGMILGLIIWALVSFVIKSFKAKEESGRFLGAFVAGLLSFAGHAVFDDFLYRPIALSFGVIIISLVISDRAFGETRRSNLSLLWFLPVLIFMFISVQWMAYPQRYMGVVIEEKIPNWAATARNTETALKAAPGSHLYHTQAAFYWMDSWKVSREESDLRAANQHFSKSLEVEPGLSWNWANKAVVSWYMGESERALSEIQAAIDLAPREPVYYLNLGRFLEGSGRSSEAQEAYLKALEQSKWLGWSSHPFWQQTDLRAQTKDAWLVINGDSYSGNTLDQFFEAYNAEFYGEAQKIYRRDVWVDLQMWGPDQLIMEGYLALLTVGDLSKAVRIFENAYGVMYSPYRLKPLGYWTLRAYRVQAIGETFVPGVIQLTSDYGQNGPLARFDDIVLNLMRAGYSEEELCVLYENYNLAISGGEINFDRSALPLACQ